MLKTVLSLNRRGGGVGSELRWENFPVCDAKLGNSFIYLSYQLAIFTHSNNHLVVRKASQKYLSQDLIFKHEQGPH